MTDMRTLYAQYEAEIQPAINCGVYTRSKSFSQWLCDEINRFEAIILEAKTAQKDCATVWAKTGYGYDQR